MLELNLQFFAAEGPGGEKTEEPTAKKKQDTRKDGKVAKSKELSSGVELIALFLILKSGLAIWEKDFWNYSRTYMRSFHSIPHIGEAISLKEITAFFFGMYT